MRVTKKQLEERAEYLATFLHEAVEVRYYDGSKHLYVDGGLIDAGTAGYIYNVMYAMLQTCWILKDQENKKNK